MRAGVRTTETMPKESETKGNDLGDALAGLVHAAQATRKAARAKLIAEAKTVLATAGKVASALGDL